MRFSLRDMRRPIVLVAATAALLAMGRDTAQAADDAPVVSVMIAPADELLGDAQYLLSLTNTVEQKQWPIVKDYLDVFLIGVDPKLVTQIQVFFDEKGSRYLSSFPVTEIKNFIDNNLSAVLGVDIIKQNADTWKLGRNRPQDTFNGFLQVKGKYAHLVTNKEDLEKTSDPASALKALIDRKFDIAVHASNSKVDAAAQARRREIFQSTRKETLGALKKLKGESDSDFNLRKKIVETQLDEGEWFFAESKEFLAGVTIDRTAGVGKVDIDLTPIEGSPLGKTVADLGSKPSHFANIEKPADPALYARINHPLNEQRQKNGATIAGMVRDRIQQQVDADAKRSAEEKTVGKQIADKVHALLEANIKAGIADGFIDVHPAGGKNNLLAGLRTVDGSAVVEIINLLPKAHSGRTVKNDVGEESGVKIHSVDFAAAEHPRLADVTGSTTLFVGTSKDAVWCAAGENALDNLKAAIKRAAGPATDKKDGVFAEMTVKGKLWIEQSLEVEKTKGDGKFRKLALDAFQQGNDVLSARMFQQGGKVKGEVTLQTGLLRLAGKVVADFSKENLDESNDKPKNAQK